MGSLRRIAAIFMALGLVLGLVGSGVGASFIWNGTATQPITIGTLNLQLDSSTNGATVNGNSLTCPAIFVDNSAGFTMAGEAVPTCNVKITSIGTAPARNVSVFMTVTSNGATLADFQVSATGAITSTKSLSVAANTPLGVATAFPAVLNFTFDYGDDVGLNELTNADMGKTITVTFSFTAAQ